MGQEGFNPNERIYIQGKPRTPEESAMIRAADAAYFEKLAASSRQTLEVVSVGDEAPEQVGRDTRFDVKIFTAEQMSKIHAQNAAREEQKKQDEEALKNARGKINGMGGHSEAKVVDQL